VSIESVAEDDLNPVAFTVELFSATEFVLQLLWRILPVANGRNVVPVFNGRRPERVSVHFRSDRVIY
jgi:hypothetical protein